MPKAVKYAPCCFKQQGIKYIRLKQTELVSGVRQCEHNMEVGHRQQFVFPCLYPCFPLSTLAFGAMTITATIIADAQMATGGTSIGMAAQRCGTTTAYSIQGTKLPCIILCTMLHSRPVCM